MILRVYMRMYSACQRIHDCIIISQCLPALNVCKQTQKLGKSSLVYACERGHKEVMMFLIEKGADGNSTDLHLRTALMHASEEGHLEVVKSLIEEGADVRAKNWYHRTALMYASWKGHLEVTKLLIEKGANVSAEDNIVSCFYSMLMFLIGQKICSHPRL
eukprot:GHVR01041682.1.p1 GENE.GHVR01041682.1~~GHVR01041682.1.p1  ORF type:complete len:160 (-),score=8.12 GHVR01041682.1:63-542(-)